MRIQHLLFATAICSSPALATVTQPKSNDQIVVTGKTEDQFRKEAYDYVRSVGHPSGNVQAARWIESVCPKATGVSADIASLVERRVRDVATRVGVPVAKAKCSPNLAIVFATPADTDKILRNYSTLADSRGRSENGPVRWWYNTQIQGQHGHIVRPQAPPSLPTNIPLPMFLPDFGTPYEPGRFQASTRRVINKAFVLIDLSQVEGKTLNSLIDYAAFVGLSEIRRDVAPENSILALFSPERQARELTRNDFSFLKTLYSMPMGRSSQQQRNTFASEMAKGIGEAEVTNRP